MLTNNQFTVWICVCSLVGMALALVGGFGVGIGYEQNYRHSCPPQALCPPPTRLNIQKHWIEVHDPNHRIVNYLDSEMLNQCDIECWPGYWEAMERGEE